MATVITDDREESLLFNVIAYPAMICICSCLVVIMVMVMLARTIKNGVINGKEKK